MQNDFYCMTQFPPSIDKQLIPDLPQAVFDGPVYTYDANKVPKDVIEYIRSRKLIGFDTETRPSFEKGVHYSLALIQIACDRECYLIRLTGKPFPMFIHELFCDPEVCKIGLSCHDDLLRMHAVMTPKPKRTLRTLFKSRKKLPKPEPIEFHPQNVIELQTYVKAFGIEDMSLQKIYAIVFGKRISKAQQLSNWEATELSPAQKQYAALDAWAVKEIYLRLKAEAIS